MRSRRCFLLAFVMPILSCGELWAQAKDWAAELERGYHAGSQAPLVAFLDAWHADSKPVTANTLKKKLPFEQDVYGIYFAFFTPAEEIYDNTKYVIIQDEITVAVVDSDLREEFTLEPLKRHLNRVENLAEISNLVVKDFRPHVYAETNGKKVLYRQDKYIAPLLGLVTQDKDPFELLRGNRYEWEENRSKERRKRLEYLNPALKIVPGPGHWGSNGWSFETYPTVSRIYLGSDMKRAIVRYRVGSHLGEALLDKDKGDHWELLSRRIDLIE